MPILGHTPLTRALISLAPPAGPNSKLGHERGAAGLSGPASSSVTEIGARTIDQINTRTRHGRHGAVTTGPSG